MLNFFKSFFPYKFKRKIKDHLGVPSLHWSLQNLKAKGFTPLCVIDIGAYEGEWTIDFLEVFPNAKVLMLEAQPAKNDKLKAIVARFTNTQFHIAILSANDNEQVLFNENETASHIAMHHTQQGMNHPSTFRYTHTVDTLLTNLKIRLPDFLKLDVQGHELEVLKGANNALSHAEIVLLEVTILDLGDETPLALEVFNYMDKNNFQIYDITQFMRRPFDKALYQMDILFIKKNSKFINEKRWN